ENMGVQMVREVAAKTSDVAGDGATTATVLAQAIFRGGGKKVAAGADPMAFRRGLDKAVAGAAVQNAASTPGLLLTTEAMISDFPGDDATTAMPGAAGGMSF